MSNNGMYETLKKERVGYYSYFLGQNIIFIFVTLFLSLYYTTALGIPPAVVGTIILVARIWDAINDPMLSILVEKTNLKGGKFKPWIRSVAILIPIITVLVFSFTDLLIASSLAVRISYAAVTYILWGMVYTISDAPAFALATVMTHDMNERNTLISFSRMGASIGIFFSMVIGPILVERTGGNWFLASLILSVIAFLFLIQIGKTKERVKSDNQSPTLKQIIQAIVQNKYVVVIVLITVFVNGFNFGMTLTPFLAEDVFKDPNLISLILAIGMLPMVLAAPLMPRLIKRFGKNNLMKFSLGIIFVFSVIIYLVGYGNINVFLILLVLKSTLSSPLLIIVSLYFADCIEYDYYKKGTRFEAAIFSAQTFSNKAMSAIAGGLGMWLLATFGFKESVAGQVVVQSQQAIDGIWVTYNLGHAFGALVALILFSIFYDLNEKKLEKIGKDSGRI